VRVTRFVQAVPDAHVLERAKHSRCGAGAAAGSGVPDAHVLERAKHWVKRAWLAVAPGTWLPQVPSQLLALGRRP
jgi:hypothetical protein